MTTDLTPTVPVHTSLASDGFYEGLDRGIVYAVRVLHAAGIDTSQSCQGGDGHAYEGPTVDVPERAFAAMETLESHGMPVREVSHRWLIVDGVPAQVVWSVELRHDAEKYADNRPMFIAGHLHRDCWATPAKEGSE